MKKILGLDLGVGSIGWCLIESDNDNKPNKILGIGSRIVPQSTDDANEFSAGNAISKNQKRTQKRTQRKGYDRYQARRAILTHKLRELGMTPGEDLIKLPVLALWHLRARAATPGQKLELPEIGRVLYHINQKRGYMSLRGEDNSDKAQRDYVKAVLSRHEEIRKEGKTIGQHFHQKLAENEVHTSNGVFYTYRIKEQVFPRAAYVEEFDKIMECQRQYYPTLLNDSTIHELRDEIIFYQRPLKSCKYLVGKCEFSLHEYKTLDGQNVISGPKVAPRSSPLFQVCKIWESVNNINLRNKDGDRYNLTIDEREKLFEFLDNHEKMTVTDMYKLLGLSKKDGWWGGKAIGRGIQGNTTKVRLSQALKGYNELLQFKLEITESKHIDTETGEILKVVSPSFEKEPLYKLWHIVYSMNDKLEMAAALERAFGIKDSTVIDRLNSIDFSRDGYGNKSSRFIREILPYLELGMMYSDACAYIGINHSNSISSEENARRDLLKHLPMLDKNELRQPVIEKILNQMIALFNTIIDKYGSIDEVRVELARELKQSRDERNETFLNNNRRERENKVIEDRIREYGIVPSRSRIQKYRLWEESEHRCFYCGQPVGVKEFLSGYDVEVEHIIPRSLFFDDSFSNKVCSCRKCNAEKGNATAFDYMNSKGKEAFEDYTSRIQDYFSNKRISKTKRDRLLTPASEIPQDFIDRQLRQSQYISKKAVDILKLACRNVWTTSGSVTDFFRHIWGYDTILQTLNIPNYKEAGLTEIVSYEHAGQQHNEERIKGWSKRMDHRHHAVDALTIACTRQSFIQRLNKLNSERDAMFKDVGEQSEKWQHKHSLLEEWADIQPHIPFNDVQQAVDKILISFKPGKKVSTPGKRCIYKNGKKTLVQDKLQIPRGALSEESVYGQISVLEEKVPITRLFEDTSIIFKSYIRTLVEKRISEFGGDWKKAKSSIAKNPIWLDDKHTRPLEYASCWRKEYVIKYPLSSIKAKDVKSIIDLSIREKVEKRILECGEKEAFKTPLYADEACTIPIRSVRMFTGLDAVEPVHYVDGHPVGFSKPGNNHHIAFYRDNEGNMTEHVVSFWHAVERKRYGVPVIINDSSEVWDLVSGQDIPESFLKNLPSPGLKLEISIQQNEMFILGMTDDEFNDAMREKDTAQLGKHLYRVQKIGSRYYVFRFHTETQVDDSNEALIMRKFYRIRSIPALQQLNPKKVRISITGDISEL